MELPLSLVDILGAVTQHRINLENLPLGNELIMVDQVLRNWPASKAQGFQDLFVANYHGYARDKFFVEFGATNGMTFSNSYMLEKHLGWRGILAEPARCWHEALRQNRACKIDTRCVWRASGETVDFFEAPHADYSTIRGFENGDYLGPQRVGGETYPVQTVSLVDLLIEHGAPPVIDYLSVDTEGTEVEILQAFDFDRFDVRAITVEHNYSATQEALYTLLSSKGFIRLMPELSRWDDWYVKPINP